MQLFWDCPRQVLQLLKHGLQCQLLNQVLSKHTCRQLPLISWYCSGVMQLVHSFKFIPKQDLHPKKQFLHIPSEKKEVSGQGL